VSEGPNVSVPGFDRTYHPARVVCSVDDYTLVQMSDGKQRWYTTSLLKSG
jgi:hypothetical protein